MPEEWIVAENIISPESTTSSNHFLTFDNFLSMHLKIALSYIWFWKDRRNWELLIKCSGLPYTLTLENDPW